MRIESMKIGVNQVFKMQIFIIGAALYDPQKNFSCLDGSKMIPFSFVNDDYCDCSDGSDEPGKTIFLLVRKHYFSFL